MRERRSWRWLAPLAPMGVAAVVLVAIWALLVGGPNNPEMLGGAALFASGGDASAGELRSGEATLDEAELGWASLVVARPDGGLIVVVEPPGGDYLVEASATGEVARVGIAFLDGGQTAMGVASDAAIAFGRDDTQGRRIGVRDRQGATSELPLRFTAGAVALRADGSVLVGGRNETRIDAVAAAGTPTGLLGPPGSDAQVVLDKPLGPIVSLLGLPDGRVVFVADTADGFVLYVLDDTEVRPLLPDGPNPVRSSGERPTDPSHRSDRLAMTPIAPAPDGRVLVTGIGRDGDPVISAVDVDTREVKPLAELDGVEPTIEHPVSAVALGNDLVFLADGKLWRLDDAFD